MKTAEIDSVVPAMGQHITAIMALVFLCSSALSAELDDSTRVVSCETDYRSPFLAGLFSYICPGAGQFYNKEREKGWEYLGVTWGSFIAGGCVLNWAENMSDDRNWALCTAAAVHLIGIGATAWVSGVVDAGRSAWRINHGERLVYPEGYRRRSPLLAGTFSALLPGGGQFYNGDTENCIRHLMIYAASAYGAIASVILTDQSTFGGFLVNMAFVSLMCGNTIWSIADAVTTANKQNLSAAQRETACTIRLLPDLALNTMPLALGSQTSASLSASLRLSVVF